MCLDMFPEFPAISRKLIVLLTIHKEVQIAAINSCKHSTVHLLIISTLSRLWKLYHHTWMNLILRQK